MLSLQAFVSLLDTFAWTADFRKVERVANFLVQADAVVPPPWRRVAGVYVWWTGGKDGEPLQDGLLDHLWFEDDNGDVVDPFADRLPDEGRGMYVASH